MWLCDEEDQEDDDEEDDDEDGNDRDDQVLVLVLELAGIGRKRWTQGDGTAGHGPG